MAQSPTARTLPPVTEEAFEADRQNFFSGFCNFGMTLVIAVIVLLVLMAIFLL
jgi:hypothetical protein